MESPTSRARLTLRSRYSPRPARCALNQVQTRSQRTPPWSVADVTAPGSLVDDNELAEFIMSYSASKQVFRDRYHPNNKAAVYRVVWEGTVAVGSDGSHGSSAAAAAADDKEGTKKMGGRITNSLDTLSKVSLPSVGRFVPTSIFEVKKTVEAVGKSAILSNDDVKRDTEKLVWPMGWRQVRSGTNTRTAVLVLPVLSFPPPTCSRLWPRVVTTRWPRAVWLKPFSLFSCYVPGA